MTPSLFEMIGTYAFAGRLKRERLLAGKSQAELAADCRRIAKEDGVGFWARWRAVSAGRIAAWESGDRRVRPSEDVVAWLAVALRSDVEALHQAVDRSWGKLPPTHDEAEAERLIDEIATQNAKVRQ